METLTTEQLDRLLEDIETIKSVLRQNASVLRQVMLPRHFRFMSALGSVIILLNCYLYHSFSSRYGEFADFPVLQRRIFVAAIIVSWLLLFTVKWGMWSRSVRKSGSGISIGRAFGEFFASQIIHIYLPLIALCGVFSIYFINSGLHYYIIPAIAIAVGVIYNAVGAVTRIRQYLIAGYWLIGTGAVTLARFWSGPVAISITLGGGLLLFALLPVGKE